MVFYLSEATINGCKSIDKKIKLSFSNITLKEGDQFKGQDVKAIYGPNGAGKSGIITAFYIYKKLITDDDALNDKEFSKFVYEAINKRNNELEISLVVFLCANTQIPIVYKHTLLIKKENEQVRIAKEKIERLQGKSIADDKFASLVSIENGEIVDIDKSKDSEWDIIERSTYNLLEKHSVLVAQKKINKITDLKKINSAIVFLNLFANWLVVDLIKDDLHTDYIENLEFLNRLKDIKNNTEIKNRINYFLNEGLEKTIFQLATNDKDTVKKTEFEEYKKNIDDLTKFIKIFIPSLKKIDIDEYEDNDYYKCKKIFTYENYQVDIEFESTGIKKLVKLYNDFKACANGKIVFIDELDANLHDVYFSKLIEFFRIDGNGQLCFTTHNVTPISILKDNSYSLDFLSNDSRLYSWTKNGNSSPLKQYVYGLIPYSTFNVNEFDFDVLLNN